MTGGRSLAATAGRGDAANASCFKTWPRLPEPLTSAASTPFSSRILRAAGAGGMTVPARAATGVAGAAAAAAGFAATVATAPSLINASSAPMPSVAPVSALISARTPAAGDGSSCVALSVSNSTSGSSTFTASPGFFSHLPTVTSAMLSPSAGTLISIAMKSP